MSLSGFICLWEHSSFEVSGMFVVYSVRDDFVMNEKSVGFFVWQVVVCD